MTAGGPSVYFVTTSDGVNYALWKSDGTSAGTVMLRNNLKGAPFNLTNVGGTLYFVANDGSSGDELWKSDGTAGSTVRVLDVMPGPMGSMGTFPAEVANVGGALFFAADTGLNGLELWTIAAPPVTGDYTADGRVDGADFLLWQRRFGLAASPAGSSADGNANGIVDAGDLTLWKTNFGGGSAIAAETTAAEVAVTVSSQSAAIDSIYAAGDFTTMFDEARFDRLLKRGKFARTMAYRS